MKNVVVIGCGAAGMMAAIAAAKAGASVIIFEKNEKPGKKIYITGKGRCNVTNACDISEYFDKIPHGSKFLYSALYGYDNTMVMDLLQSNGCKLKTERGDRVFPVSDHSSDIISTLVKVLKKNKVEIRYQDEVTWIQTDSENNVKAVVSSDSGITEADAVIVCTGGLSYPSTGSTGTGHKIAKELGHKVTELKPSLVPFEIKEDWCRELQGLSLKNVAVKLEQLPPASKDVTGGEGSSGGKKKKKIVYDGFGEMLFTHFGVSGPLILTSSCYYEEKDKKGNPLEYVIHLDLKPALTHEQLDKRLQREFEVSRNRQFKNSLNSLFPSKLIPVMISLSGIDPEKPLNSVTKKERADFVNLIKDLRLTVTGTRNFNEAIITRGGIATGDINPSTMESKKIKGLYFAGEIIDVDAQTGGFNLQIAWSTGHLAGESAAAE
ncbi:NAD(P)/FAD-dependent oxidoreductase [Butyrivibrio sp. WCD3002]|uniref:NAD(P)/FAD-dependent oxidoreductase n=1 Tax=Butyrivibrio sp. WCD3002 TaxID=1280676 RepID=UPI00040C36CF|nr:NAD(P)/FAD-dependent oxidoreductase [Butyrivibrio sp. WCD3002]